MEYDAFEARTGIVSRKSSPLVLSFDPIIGSYDNVTLGGQILTENNTVMVGPANPVTNPIEASVSWWGIGPLPVPNDPDYGGQILVAVVSGLVLWWLTK